MIINLKKRIHVIVLSFSDSNKDALTMSYYFSPYTFQKAAQWNMICTVKMQPAILMVLWHE